MNACDRTQDGTDGNASVVLSASVAGDSAPQEVLVAPWGEVKSASGDFVVDEEAGRLVVAAFAAHGTDLPIDYEHQTLGGSFAAPDGKAPAAGWIKRLEARPGVGLIAHIEWTPPARELLRTRQYRYLSPVAMVRREDRRMAALHSVALTNKPAIVGMTPIISAAGGGEAVAALRLRLALPAEAGADEVLVAASARLAEVEREGRERRAAERVGDALRSGRLTDAQRGWAETLVLRDERLFDEWLATAPVVVPCGATAPPAGEGGPARQRGLEAAARAEFRGSPLLAALTSEEAYVAAARRSV